jgi:RES domain-containing protein
MGSAWRIVLESEAATAFSGEGAWRYGGRWNSQNIRVIYASEHQSTAALEVFVHNKPFSPNEKYKAFRLEWPDSITERFPTKKLPANWRVLPPPMETREIGDRWVQERRSAVLALPSAISPADTNFLLNPDHKHFKCVRIHPPIDFAFDSRLLDR